MYGGETYLSSIPWNMEQGGDSAFLSQPQIMLPMEAHAPVLAHHVGERLEATATGDTLPIPQIVQPG